MIFGSFIAAVDQMFDRRFMQVLFIGVGLTVLLLFGVSAAFVWIVNAIVGDTVTLPIFGEISWLDDMASFGTAVALAFLSTFLMVPVAALILPFFLERVAKAVEAQSFPELPPVPKLTIFETVLDGLSFQVVFVLANLLALILYVFLLVFFPPLAPLVFWTVNGFLLGREYFMLAAMRRVGRDKARTLRTRHALKIWTAGFLMAVPLSIPLLNLVIPILGAATFTHLFHRLAPPAPSGQTSPNP